MPAIRRAARNSSAANWYRGSWQTVQMIAHSFSVNFRSVLMVERLS